MATKFTHVFLFHVAEDWEPGDVEKEVMREIDDETPLPVTVLDLSGDGSEWEDWN